MKITVRGMVLPPAEAPTSCPRRPTIADDLPLLTYNMTRNSARETRTSGEDSVDMVERLRLRLRLRLGLVNHCRRSLRGPHVKAGAA